MLVPVYDIISCGPRRRFVANGKLVHNSDSVNLQNLPARGPQANKLKNAILPPEGHVIIDCDSAQIEARTLAWLAGQDDLVEAFAKKQDVYKLMASKIYGKDPDDISKGERQVGKTVILGCFGPDTLVLTKRGWVPMLHVQATDMVWDGLTWVAHQGVVAQGEKEVWTYKGISATSDHEILTAHGWEAWSEVIENRSRWKSAIHVASLLSLSGAHIRRPVDALSDGTLFANVRAGGPALSYGKTFSKGVAHAAILAPKLRGILNVIGRTKAYVQTKLRALGYLIGLHPASGGAITNGTGHTSTTVLGGYSYMNRGEPIDQRFFDTSLRWKDTTNPHWSWIGSTWIAGMYRAISALWGVQPTWQIAVASATYKVGSTPLKQRMQTYDIAYAGPRNRYTILSEDGPLVVHNCGYGVGHKKLRAFLKVQAGVEVDEAESRRIVDTYRHANHRIVDLWKKAGTALTYLAGGMTYVIDAHGVCIVAPKRGITLPNKLTIQYPGLRQVASESGKAQWVYDSKGEVIYVYGGKVVENLTQAVARCIVAEQMLLIAKRYPVVLTVHDAVACVAPREEAEAARAFVEDCMRSNPSWAKGLPLSCESGVGESYGAC